MDKIGFYGIVVPGDMFCQGYALVDGEQPRKYLAELQERLPVFDEGVLGAIAAEAARDDDASLLITASLGISEILKTNFFIVFANPTNDGWEVHVELIDEDTVEDARDALSHHPIVLNMSDRAAMIAMKPSGTC